jgi:hypothetical protein
VITDEQIVRLFDDIEFRDEPPMETTVDAYVVSGERRLRRRRVVTWSGGFAAAVAVAAGVALALPLGEPRADPSSGVIAPGTPDISRPPPDATTSPTKTAPAIPETTPDDFGFSATRQLLLDTAVEHFDADRSHLPEKSSSFHGGGIGGKEVGTKLSWTIPGESGEGMLYVAVTAPGYAAADEYAIEGFAGLATELELADYTRRELPGTGEQAWVAEGVQTGGFGTLAIGVVYERPDGSLVGVGAYDQFGNNSLEPVSTIDIDLQQAASFVTDPDLAIAPADRKVEAQWAEFFDWLVKLDEDQQSEYLTRLEAEQPERLHEMAMAPGSPLVPDESGWVVEDDHPRIPTP